MPEDAARHVRSRPRGLSLAQRSAIDLLVSGKNDRETAQLLNVARPTVTKWRRYNPAFQAALEVRRNDVWGADLDRLRSLIPPAIDALAEALVNPLRNVRVPLALLRLGKFPLAPPRARSAEEIFDDRVKERMRSKKAMRQLDVYGQAAGVAVSVEEQYRIAAEEVLAEIEAGLSESDDDVPDSEVAMPAANLAGERNIQEQRMTPAQPDGGSPEAGAAVASLVMALNGRVQQAPEGQPENEREHPVTKNDAGTCCTRSGDAREHPVTKNDAGTPAGNATNVGRLPNPSGGADAANDGRNGRVRCKDGNVREQPVTAENSGAGGAGAEGNAAGAAGITLGVTEPHAEREVHDPERAVMDECQRIRAWLTADGEHSATRSELRRRGTFTPPPDSPLAEAARRPIGKRQGRSGRR